MEATDENIAEALNYATKSDDVVKLIEMLDKSGKFKWDSFGRMEMNVNTAEAAELSPIETLCEKVTNQVDALIEWKVNESSQKSFATPRQAIAAFYPAIPEGKLRNLSTEISQVSEMKQYDCEMRLIESGVENKPTIVFVDTGCGNAASEADRRILSLNKGNKNRISYFMGAFGRGGSTYLRHCKNGLSIVISRPRNHPESNLVCWTIIRKVGGALSEFKTTEKAKTAYYQMLVNKDNSIPAISAEIFEMHSSKSPRLRLAATDLPNASESLLVDLRRREASFSGGYGTFVKLFDFDFHVTPRGEDSKAMASQSMTRAGWQCLNSYLFDLPYPVAVTDSRDVQKDDIYRFEDGKGKLIAPSERFPVTRIIYGNVRRLELQKKHGKIKDKYEVERKILYQNCEHGTIAVRLWFFKGESGSESVNLNSYIETNKSKTRIFLTLNGQTIFKEGRDWSGFEELELYSVPIYTLIQVELDNLSDDFKTDLYDSARKIFDSKMAVIIFDELKDVIDSCPNLQDLENYYDEIQKKMLAQEKNAKLERQLRNLIAEPGFQILNPRAKSKIVKWRTHKLTKYPWIERDPPTWIDPFPAGEVEIPTGEEKRIRLRHNGPARLFSRKIKCGKVELVWQANKGFQAKSNGTTIMVTVPQESVANEEDMLIVRPFVGKKKYPEHHILIRATPSSFEPVDPPTKFEIVKIAEPMKVRSGGTFKISISTDAYNDIFERPNRKWRLRWELASTQAGLDIKNMISEKSRESPRNGRIGLYFVVDKNMQVGAKFTLSVQLAHEENPNLSLPVSSIECETVWIEKPPRDREWYERRKKISSGKGVKVIDVKKELWSKPPYEDWDSTSVGMLAPNWKKATDVEFHINCDCDPYRRAMESKDPKWKTGKEKDNIYRLLICDYLWDYENRKNKLEDKEYIKKPEFKESEKISARSMVEVIMRAIEELD